MQLTRENIIKKYGSDDLFTLLDRIDQNDEKLFKFVFTTFGSKDRLNWKLEKGVSTIEAPTDDASFLRQL